MVVAIVPFDPESAWQLKPVKLTGRRHGWPVKGSLNGVKFEGYIGERWGRFFVTFDATPRAEAGGAVGEQVSVVLAATTAASVFEKAKRQSVDDLAPQSARRCGP